MRSVLILLAFAISGKIIAQTSVLQDKSGQSTLVINTRGATASINTGATSVAGSYSQYKIDTAGKEKAWGFNVKLKAVNGASAVLSGYDFKPQADLGFFKISYLKPKNTAYQFLFYGGGLTLANNSILRQDNSYTFDSRKFFGYNVKLGYNVLSQIGKLPWLSGITLTFARVNNVSDLKSVQVAQTTTTTVNGKQTTVTSSGQTGLSGVYQTTSPLQLNFDSYCFITKNHQIGVGGYGRSQLTGTGARSNAGAGIIFGKKGAPDNIVLGLFYQFNDIFHQLDRTSNDFIRRGGVNVVAGYSF